ncbi:MAG: HAD family hydrolase [Eggerthellaceae bacterium]|jgi:pyrophosphatase PpaX
MQRVYGILFDNDGTLLDTHDLLVSSMRYATQKVLGKDLPEEKLMAKVGQPLAAQMWDFTDDEAVHEELLAVYREYNHAHHDQEVSLFPGVKETLAMLKDEGFPMGVVTSKRHELAIHGLSLFGIEQYFDFLVGADDWETAKPHPGPVKHACDMMDLSPRQVMYVGDSPFDAQAANGAGCISVAALWGMFDKERLEKEEPDYFAATFSELPLLVTRLNS